MFCAILNCRCLYLNFVYPESIFVLTRQKHLQENVPLWLNYVESSAIISPSEIWNVSFKIMHKQGNITQREGVQ